MIMHVQNIFLLYVANINSETQFLTQFKKRGTNENFIGCQVPYFIIVLLPYINLLNLSWIKKCLFLRNMKPLKLICSKTLGGHWKTVQIQIREPPLIRVNTVCLSKGTFVNLQQIKQTWHPLTSKWICQKAFLGLWQTVKTLIRCRRTWHHCFSVAPRGAICLPKVLNDPFYIKHGSQVTLKNQLPVLCCRSQLWRASFHLFVSLSSINITLGVLWAQLCMCFLHGMRMCMWFEYTKKLLEHFVTFSTFWTLSFFTLNIYSHVDSERNSSYSFVLIVLKLCMCFLHGRRICMWFGYKG